MLPLLSKVFEKLLCHKWLKPVIRDKLGGDQFAYVPGVGKGTTNAITSLYLHILKYLDQKPGAVRVLAVDLSKAFDKLTHVSILRACISFNFSRDITLLIMSYLSNRKHRVVLNGTFSQWANVTSGVPQGSVLGPILFCLVMDSLKPVNENSIYVKYADDLTVLNFFRQTSDDNLQSELHNVKSWCVNNSLTVNLDKSFVMNVITKKSLTCEPIVFSEECVLPTVPALNILGTFLSSDLKWNRHVDFCVKKASKRIFLISSLKRANCPPKLLFDVYRSCIRSVLLYPFPVFCNAPKFLLRKILNVEKRVLKIINSENFSEPSIFKAGDRMCEELFCKVTEDAEHPLRYFFIERSFSNSRSCAILKKPATKTQRFLNSFIRYCT